MARNSIPVIQSALAIYKLTELPYSGPIHYFLQVLLNKRYALPLKVCFIFSHEMYVYFR